MDTLEERNLNRLRKGKMMLEYTELKRSPIFTFTLAFFFGLIGAHRFYLGHKALGVLLALFTVFVFILAFNVSAEIFEFFIVPYVAWLLVEIILAPVFTSYANRKIKNRLLAKYNVVETI